MTQKYLFLDIDGVLNSREVMTTWKHPDAPSFRALSTEMIERLNRLVDILDCQIILSSVWRNDRNFEDVERLFREFGMKREISGRTPWTHETRGEEIQMYMKEHNITADQIVILDDDSDMVHLLPRLVQTTWKEGLQDHHVEEALALFE